MSWVPFHEYRPSKSAKGANKLALTSLYFKSFVSLCWLVILVLIGCVAEDMEVQDVEEKDS